jgi:kynurenine formamidase
VGVETIGTDAGQAGRFDPPFPNHSTMHGAGKFGLASLCNLEQLPAVGAVVIAAPLKLVHGSGSPLRVIAIAP